MASIRDLKKDINNVLGDLIEAVYVVDGTSDDQNSKEGSEIIENAIDTFDELIAKVNRRDIKDRKKHLQEVRKELEVKAQALSDKINKL
jgi:hypothetical protein